jgi:Tfp pilus assembly protein PilF
MRLAASFALCTSLAACAGCASWNAPGQKYQTIIADPHHDGQTAKARTHQAAKAWEKNHCDKAEQLLQEALAADVNYGPAHNNLGLLYFQQGRYYLAAWEFQYAMETMSDRPEPFNNLGMVFEKVERREAALEHYQMARDRDSANSQYLGNFIRVLLKEDDKDAAAPELLRDLLLIETRPEWRCWAEERLATGKFNVPPPAESTATDSKIPVETEELKVLPQLRLPSQELILPGEAELPPPSG